MDCERVGCGCLVWLRLIASCLFVGLGRSFSLGLGKPHRNGASHGGSWCYFLSHVYCAPN